MTDYKAKLGELHKRMVAYNASIRDAEAVIDAIEIKLNLARTEFKAVSEQHYREVNAHRIPQDIASFQQDAAQSAVRALARLSFS